MEFGERRVISSVVLQAEDLDTPPERVFYFLKVEPGFGKLLLKVEADLRVEVGAGPAGPSSPSGPSGPSGPFGPGSVPLLFLVMSLTVDVPQTGTGWTELSAGQNFTQEDVELNRLWYQHAAPAAPGFKGHDSFVFCLSDLDHQSPAQSFFIWVKLAQRGQRWHVTPHLAPPPSSDWCVCCHVTHR